MTKKLDIYLKILAWGKANLLLLIILLTAFTVRWYGIYYNYPYGVESIGDESATMKYLMDIINSKSPFAGFSSYPVLMAFFYFPVLVIRIIYLAVINEVYSLEEIKGFIIGNGIGQIYIIIRWFSVFMGTASVFLIYKIYSLIFRHKASYHYAALVYTFSLIPVLLSHWGRMHIPMMLFFLISLFYVLKFEIDKKERYLILSSLGAAMSFSSHYIGIMAFVLPLAGFLFNRATTPVKLIIKSLGACIPVFLLAFAINYKGVFAMFSGVFTIFIKPNNFTGLFSVGVLERFYYGLIDVFMIEPVFFVLFVILLIANFKLYFRSKLTRYVLVALSASYILLLGVAGAHLSRWLLAFITFSVTLGAGTLSEYMLNRNIRKVVVYIILLVFLLPNIFFTGRLLKLFHVNTRNEAVKWSRENVKANEFIYVFDLWLDAPLSHDAIAWDEQFNKRASKKQLYLLEHPDHINEAEGVNMVFDFNNERFENLAGDKTKYVLFHYWLSDNGNEYREFPAKYHANLLINEVKAYHHLELVKTFFPTKNEKMIASGVDDYFNSPHNWRDLLYLDKGGPFIEIYEIK